MCLLDKGRFFECVHCSECAVCKYVVGVLRAVSPWNLGKDALPVSFIGIIWTVHVVKKHVLQRDISIFRYLSG